MRIIVKTCVILHNMIVNRKRDTDPEFVYDAPHISVQPNSTHNVSFLDFVKNAVAIRNSEVHFQLRDDLVKHLWGLKGTSRTKDDDETS
ncbi:hypothetical protein PSTG_14130 [Puccinia striiformis f. sp. tritici PST-78]|uniref:Uncharacterized protein n=1 Tax=Puccinia striiformis f. sp. tritici PST-78 TaxID=1165861 RepID=A0A0L0UZL3_9BASI|nr:hypothetical protein PSTG_14130 [Puccinia striiformis f. sp. tritici PST-78]